jgi:hypothetical protein
MRAVLLVVAELLTPAVAAAQQADAPRDPGYSYPRFMRTMVGLGSAPNLPRDDNQPNVVFTTEIGGRPLSGALGTGVSLSETIDTAGQWSVLTPGLLAQLDLTYLFATAFYSYPPPPRALVHLEVGARLGFAFSQSSRPDVAYAAMYSLWRPELQPFFDADIPLPGDRHYTLLMRGALDGPVNMSDIFRWSLSVGFNYAWGEP